MDWVLGISGRLGRARGLESPGKHGNISVSLPCQCSALGKEDSGKARSKVELAGSPLTAWKRWQTDPRKESKVRRNLSAL